MTDKPIPCRYDHQLRARVLQRDGADPEPCNRPHCTVCGRAHTTLATPLTCPECQGKVDDDLVDLQSAYTALALEALYAGSDGRLVAAAPIPGGTAAVLIGPTVRLDVVRVSRTFHEDHRPRDPIPPLAVLAQWEDMYRAYLDHHRAGRATVAGAIQYLRDQLPYIAQRSDGPDWLAFTRQVRNLRSQLEHALHDEREPERGVECFECGEQLVRRFRDPKRCRHSTKARRWVQTLASYGLQIHGTEWRAARMPCQPCAAVGQGGIDDPSAGRSWECPGCRKEYDAAEYGHAVRRSLLDGDGSGWCTMQVAAAAAADITGRSISAPTIRVWISRGDDIAVCCSLAEGRRTGVQLVYWPDVLKRATEQRTRRTRNAS